jgi:hypothetical protein
VIEGCLFLIVSLHVSVGQKSRHCKRFAVNEYEIINIAIAPDRYTNRMNTNLTHSPGSRSWIGAYGAFLRSRDENLILKAAPLLIIFGSPEILVSNLLPVVGEVLDIGAFGISVLVLVRTFSAVRKYR